MPIITNPSSNDLITAYVVRFVILGALAFLVKTSVESRDILIKGDIPQMQRDINELKQQGQRYITNEQLNSAVKARFDELMKARPITTDTNTTHQ